MLVFISRYFSWCIDINFSYISVLMTITMCISLFHLTLFHKVFVYFVAKYVTTPGIICSAHWIIHPGWLFNQGLYSMFWWRVLCLRSFSTSTAFSKQISHSKSMCKNAYLHITFIFEHLKDIYVLCMCVFMLTSMYCVSDLTWLLLLLVFLPIFENCSSTIFFLPSTNEKYDNESIFSKHERSEVFFPRPGSYSKCFWCSVINCFL